MSFNDCRACRKVLNDAIAKEKPCYEAALGMEENLEYRCKKHKPIGKAPIVCPLCQDCHNARNGEEVDFLCSNPTTATRIYVIFAEGKVFCIEDENCSCGEEDLIRVSKKKLKEQGMKI